MLPKRYRLNKKEINQLKAGRRPVVQGKFFGLLFESRPTGRKFGLIISNKICPKATERNRIKRQLFRAIEESFPEKTGWFLFLAKKSSVGAGEEEILQEVAAFRKKVG